MDTTDANPDVLLQTDDLPLSTPTTTVEKLSDTYVMGSPPAPEPTAVPPIGMNDAATVDQGPGNRIDVTLADGTEFSLFAGYVADDGVTRSYHRSGYIRDNDLGQTYAVVKRDVDGMVVRVWIPAGSDLRERGAVGERAGELHRRYDGGGSHPVG